MKKEISELKVIVINPPTKDEAKRKIEEINTFLAFKYSKKNLQG